MHVTEKPVRSLFQTVARATCAAALLSLVGCGGDAAAEHVKRGEAAITAGSYAEALSAFGHARELAPQDGRVQRGMMRARAYLAAEQPGRITADAMTDLEYELTLLLDTDKNDTAVYLTAMGNMLQRRGDYEGAKAKFSQALNADPASALAHTALGLLLLSKKESAAQAKQELEHAVKLNPQQVGALIALGQLASNAGDTAGAIAQVQAALKVRDEFTAHLLLGSLYAKQNKSQDAADEYQRAAGMEPKSADAWSGAGHALLAANKPDEAERALRTAFDLRQDGSTVAALGYALQGEGKASEALAVFTRILSQDATAPRALLGAGAAAESLGMKDKAADYYKQLVALPPEGGTRHELADLQKQGNERLAVLSGAAPAAPAPAMGGIAPLGGPGAVPPGGAVPIGKVPQTGVRPTVGQPGQPGPGIRGLGPTGPAPH